MVSKIHRKTQEKFSTEKRRFMASTLDLGENSGSPLALIYHSFRQLVMAVKLMMAWRKLL